MLGRFHKHVKKVRSGCWEWQGCKLPSGYGRFMYLGKSRLAHRVSAVIYKRFNINSKSYICHKCDNKKCVNPKHLFIGDALVNMRDARKKGLFPSSRGTSNHSNKLSKNDCNKIRKLLLRGDSTSLIARKFNISVQPVYAIAQNRHWSTNA